MNLRKLWNFLRGHRDVEALKIGVGAYFPPDELLARRQAAARAALGATAVKSLRTRRIEDQPDTWVTPRTDDDFPIG